MAFVGISRNEQRYARIRHRLCGLELDRIQYHQRPGRIRCIEGRVLYMFHHPHYDSFGERCGAVVTYVEMQALIRDLKKVVPVNPQNLTTNDICPAYHHVTKYIVKIMDAPGRNSSLYFSFERIYLDTEDEAIEREEERTKIACTRRITFGHRKVANASLAA